MTRRLLLLGVLLASSAHVAFAQDQHFLAGLDPYQPLQPVTGTIRSRGNNFTSELMKLWQEGFRRYHPGVRFETKLDGSETAIAGLYAGIAELAFLGREIYEPEQAAFRERFGYESLGIEITTGSYDTPHKSFALMFFVHKDNPLTSLTMEQIGGLIGCDRPVRTWGQLGLANEWANRPLHVYGYGTDSGFARFLRKLILKDNYKWNSEMQEFYNVKAADDSDIDSGKLILDALAKDPYGIACSNVCYTNTDVKTVAVASSESGPFVEPTKETVWKRIYPIVRSTSVFINRVPGKPVDPEVKEFLRYILSRDGQEAVLREGSYLPLTPDLLRDQQRKLE